MDCLQNLVNPDSSSNIFGPTYPTSNINYMNILARCPADCHKVQGTVLGRGLHPDISPICLSALIDRAVSDYGGIISLSIFPGQDKYVILNQNDNIKNERISAQIKTVSYYGKPAKSYTIAKVDNVDLSERDIRILNAEGKYSNEGRVEMRINGKWGPVCNKSNNADSAQRICMDVGYNYGSWANPDDKQNSFCKSYKGKDYCGSGNLSAFYGYFYCTKEDSSINTCVKKYANPLECGLENNAIITCTSKSSETPEGLIKLVKVVMNSELNSNNGNHIGRLEMFIRGEFKPVCKNGFNGEAANVACRQMGYLAGQLITPDQALQITKSALDDTPFAATEVKCTGSEKNLSECNMKLDNIICTHDLDVVLKCDGVQTADYTGKSQMIHGKEGAPALGRLSAVKIKADCATTGTDKKFRGDAGSVYLVSCPKNCKSHKGGIWGVGIYTLDSNVCLAAVHAGVLNDDKGGSFAYVKTWGQKFYASMKRNGVESSELRDDYLVSFSVASLNSQWKNIWKLWKHNSV